MSETNKKNRLGRWLGSKNLVDLLIYGKCLLIRLASLAVYRSQLRVGFLPLIEAFPSIRGRGQVRIGKHARIGGKVIVRFDDPESNGTLVIGDRFTSDGTVRICPRGGRIEIGTNVFFGPDTLVQSYKDSKIAIGNNVMIAAGCKIFGSNHSVDNEATPMRTKPEVAKGIVIEDDVWIGTQACLLDGVTIGTGAVIAAGAVVTKPVAPGMIVAGVPARVISRR